MLRLPFVPSPIDWRCLVMSQRSKENPLSWQVALCAKLFARRFFAPVFRVKRRVAELHSVLFVEFTFCKAQWKTHTHIHTHSLTRFLSHTRSRSLSSLSLSLSLTHTHSHTNTHTHAHTHTHNSTNSRKFHTLSLCSMWLNCFNFTNGTNIVRTFFSEQKQPQRRQNGFASNFTNIQFALTWYLSGTVPLVFLQPSRLSNLKIATLTRVGCVWWKRLWRPNAPAYVPKFLSTLHTHEFVSQATLSGLSFVANFICCLRRCSIRALWCV